ncbi:MAG: alcohol dehydrogenase catalytic domain-containing protein [Candidatus Omnitrophica bacterium]|nr:alcohol dehydrogenase catalytic domain-containing protein [Candidatus Omnitrophota bacterium]MCM8802698.1 alcohol dehydrogenase catalytic domain-containing protein [Candidatus Omnitrophota bacterium]
MKVAYLVGKKKIEIEEEKCPEIKNEKDVLIKIRCVGICGSDVHYFLEGKIGDQIVKDKIILGHEASGEVVETGKDVKRLKKGDKVAIEPGISCGKCESCKKGKPNTCPYVKFLGTPPINGAFREYIVMPEENLIKIPDGLGYEEGVLSEPLAIGIYSVKLSQMEIGDDVAILGAGPIGLSILFSVRESGANKIFVSDLIEERLKFAKDLGADFIIDAKKEDIVEIVKNFTNNRGVDISFEAAGKRETFRQVIHTTKICGKSVLVGIPSEDTVEFEAHIMRRKELKLINVRRSAFCTEIALNMMKNSKLSFSKIITHRYPIEKIEEALNLVSEYKDGVIKCLVNL